MPIQHWAFLKASTPPGKSEKGHIPSPPYKNTTTKWQSEILNSRSLHGDRGSSRPWIHPFMKMAYKQGAWQTEVWHTEKNKGATKMLLKNVLKYPAKPVTNTVNQKGELEGHRLRIPQAPFWDPKLSWKPTENAKQNEVHLHQWATRQKCSCSSWRVTCMAAETQDNTDVKMQALPNDGQPGRFSQNRQSFCLPSTSRQS